MVIWLIGSRADAGASYSAGRPLFHPGGEHDIYARGAGGPERAGATLDGRAGGQDVVHQEQPGAGDARAPPLGGFERPGHVAPAARTGLAALTVGAPPAAERIGPIGQASGRGQGAGDLRRLVVATLEQTPTVERRRHDRVRIAEHVGGGAGMVERRRLGLTGCATRAGA